MRYVAECQQKRFWKGRLWSVGECYVGDDLPPPQFRIDVDAGDPEDEIKAPSPKTHCTMKDEFGGAYLPPSYPVEKAKESKYTRKKMK